jgi:hypothetical protein
MANAGWEKISLSDKPDVLITFAGLSLTLKSSHAWAVALAAAMPSSAKGGVGEAFAVTGPNAEFHAGSLADALAPHFAEDAPKRIHVVSHSSGVEYSRKLFDLLMANKDAKKAKRLFYYNVDGGNDAETVKKGGSLFGQALAVSGFLVDEAGNTIPSRNHGVMKELGAAFQKMGLGKFVDLDLGKKKGSDKWPPDRNILHMALINSANPLWFKSSKESAPYVKGFPAFYVEGINPTYASCKKENVTADYIK